MEREEIQELQNKIKEKVAFINPLKTEMQQILSGQEELINGLILALIADGHVLLEGLPGLAKTMAIQTLSQCLNGQFSRIQFTPDLLPADVTGTTIYNIKEHTFNIKKGPIFANIVLADEINRAPAKVQSALLEAMQEKQVTIGGETHILPKPFLVMATQNPIEQEGTYPLPEAQVDRFLMKLLIKYPKRDEEKTVILRMAHTELKLKALQVASLEDIEEARKYVDKVYIDDKIFEYILDIVIATRPKCHSELSSRQADADLKDFATLIQVGASPRASIALAICAKASAFMDGRAFVVPQDVKNVARGVLRHRILVSYEAEAENIDSDALINTILDKLRTP